MSGRYHLFPERIVAGEGTWVKIPGRHATVDDNAETVEFPSGEIAPEKITAAHRPVYERQPGSAPGAPTGRVYVRMSAGVRAADRAAEITAAGYEIVESPAYAPGTAWLRAASGEASDGLSRLDALRRVPGVESAEPQMLSVRAMK